MLDTGVAAALDVLKTNMAGLDAGSKGYASLLVTKAASSGILTHKERTWLLQTVSQLHSNVLVPVFKPKSLRTGPYAELMDRFDQAAAYTKYPRLRFLNLNHPLQFSRTGSGSPQPGTVSITNAGAYGSSKFYGRIDLNGTAQLSVKANTELETGLSHCLLMLKDKFQYYVGLHGVVSQSCSVCSRGLKDAASKRSGYHKVCAQRWGLKFLG